MLPLDVVVSELRAVGALSAPAAGHQPQTVTRGLVFPLAAALAG